MALTDARFRRILAGIITGAWAVSFVLDAVMPDYNPPAGVQALMVIVAGWIFAVPVAQAARGKDIDE